MFGINDLSRRVDALVAHLTNLAVAGRLDRIERSQSKVEAKLAELSDAVAELITEVGETGTRINQLLDIIAQQPNQTAEVQQAITDIRSAAARLNEMQENPPEG